MAQGLQLFLQIFGAGSKRLDPPLGFQPLINIAEDEGVIRLSAITEARECRLGREERVIPTLDGEAVRNPELALAVGAGAEFTGKEVQLAGTCLVQERSHVFAN